MKKKLLSVYVILFSITLLLTTKALDAAVLFVKTDAPQEYTVKSNDNFFAVLNRYVNTLDQWRALFKNTGKVPLQLYPGQRLQLMRVDGTPQLQVFNTGGTIKLSPKIRIEKTDTAIPTLDRSVITPFQVQTRVLNDKNTLIYAPYIVAIASEHVEIAAGAKFYGMNLPDPHVGETFGIYKAGKVYSDKKTRQPLGYEAIFLGKAEVVQPGNPATLIVTSSEKAISKTDKLLPLPPVLSAKITLHVPKQMPEAHIIDILNGLEEAGKYQAVVIDKGLCQGIQVGDILKVQKPGKAVTDPVQYHSGFQAKIQLPDEHIANLLIFQGFDNVSYGLILYTTAPVTKGDLVTTFEW